MIATVTQVLGPTDFAAPIDDRWFADYVVGETYEYGKLALTSDEIVEFGRRYDPQRLHTDPDWAATGPFGGLIASGWQTAGLMMRMYCEHYISAVASLASPGVDELRWPAPLRPGEDVRLRVTVAESRVSRSKPDRGIVRTRIELLTDNDRAVLTGLAMNMVAVRP
ncbi:MaoC family dehydratase [Actinomycetospora sp. OC33-EN08]|uniref:MaoC family dehydratase n=1 Tax=Actinomycetospora aurantiaca TaxID=3129233 RepID=A0ABU8MHZ5_9PSEU